MNSREPKTHGIRCGECCLRSSPTLHAKDLPLVVGGSIRLEQLYTIPKGELVRDNVHRRIVPEEMDFFLGKPLMDTLVRFGLKEERQMDGGFLPTRI